MTALTQARHKVWLGRATFVGLTAIGAARIVSSSSAFFQTSDEGLHIACGVLWMNGRHIFACLDQPPLARIASVLPLYLTGVLPAGFSRFIRTENDFEPEKDQSIVALRKAFASAYERTLKLARLGILPFFVAASCIVWIWSRRWFDDLEALTAVFLFQGLPLVLAHAGLVTTDMAATAFVPAAFYFFVRWLERPTAGRSALLGLAVGLAILAKHSAVPFLAVGATLIGIAKWIEERHDGGIRRFSFRRRLRTLFIAAGIVFAIAWAGYGFSLTPAALPTSRPHKVFRVLGIDHMLSGHPGVADTLNRALEAPIPFGDLARGARLALGHDETGHPSFLFGEVRSDGWWYFFPALIALKTPLPFLVLVAIGCACLWRAAGPVPAWQRLAPLLAAAGILLVGMTSRINIGLRHILPLYLLLAIVAGVGLNSLASTRRYRGPSRLAAAMLVVWFIASSVRAHPDYLPYFNELVRNPEKIVADSDLDWGQDVKRLFAALRDLDAEKLWYACLGCSYLKMAGPFRLPDAPGELQELEPYRRVSGWVAVSEWAFVVRGEMERRQAGKDRRAFDWLDSYPFRRIGRSIRLYHVPENGAQGEAPQ
jgi:4-amino-4-deoxy-L-arabinose transferase-like glycosyltransferase